MKKKYSNFKVKNETFNELLQKHFSKVAKEIRRVNKKNLTTEKEKPFTIFRFLEIVSNSV